MIGLDKEEDRTRDKCVDGAEYKLKNKKGEQVGEKVKGGEERRGEEA